MKKIVLIVCLFMASHLGALEPPYTFTRLDRPVDRLNLNSTIFDLYNRKQEASTAVNITADQSIGGDKTFTDNVTLNTVTFTSNADIFNAIIPAGFEMQYVSTVPPAGYNLMFEDGRSLSTSTYANLFLAIGYSHGGSGANFNIPDSRGRFARGVANGSTNDPDRALRSAMNTGGSTGDAVGSVQSYANVSHGHSINHDHAAASTATDGSHSHTFGNYAGAGYVDSEIQCARGDNGSYYTASTFSGGTHSHSFDMPNFTGNSGDNGGNESRPINRNVAYLIKY